MIFYPKCVYMLYIYRYRKFSDVFYHYRDFSDLQGIITVDLLCTKVFRVQIYFTSTEIPFLAPR